MPTAQAVAARAAGQTRAAGQIRAGAALALVFNAFTFGVSWWPFRQFGEIGLHPLWLTAISYSIGTLALIALRPAALGELLRTPSLWGLVLGAGITNACFNWAVSLGDVVRVVLLFYLMPLWTVLLARVLLGERISLRGAGRVLLALAGALVVLWPAAGSAASAWPLPRNLPEALGVLGGIGFALNNVMLKHEAHRSPAACALAMFGGGAVVALLLAVGFSQTGHTPWPPAPAIGWIAGAAGLAAWFLLANLSLQRGASRLPANTTSVIMLTEVFFASASALALGAGTLGPQEALGALMILGAALLASVQRD
jgi:drug/metabolite transporter (DMT)-like permease